MARTKKETTASKKNELMDSVAVFTDENGELLPFDQ